MLETGANEDNETVQHPAMGGSRLLTNAQTTAEALHVPDVLQSIAVHASIEDLAQLKATNKDLNNYFSNPANLRALFTLRNPQLSRDQQYYVENAKIDSLENINRAEETCMLIEKLRTIGPGKIDNTIKVFIPWLFAIKNNASSRELHVDLMKVVLDCSNSAENNSTSGINSLTLLILSDTQLLELCREHPEKYDKLRRIINRDLLLTRDDKQTLLSFIEKLSINFEATLPYYTKKIQDQIKQAMIRKATADILGNRVDHYNFYYRVNSKWILECKLSLLQYLADVNLKLEHPTIFKNFFYGRINDKTQSKWPSNSIHFVLAKAMCYLENKQWNDFYKTLSVYGNQYDILAQLKKYSRLHGWGIVNPQQLIKHFEALGVEPHKSEPDKYLAYPQHNARKPFHNIFSPSFNISGNTTSSISLRKSAQAFRDSVPAVTFLIAATCIVVIAGPASIITGILAGLNILSLLTAGIIVGGIVGGIYGLYQVAQNLIVNYGISINSRQRAENQANTYMYEWQPQAVPEWLKAKSAVGFEFEGSAIKTIFNAPRRLAKTLVRVVNPLKKWSDLTVSGTIISRLFTNPFLGSQHLIAGAVDLVIGILMTPFQDKPVEFFADIVKQSAVYVLTGIVEILTVPLQLVTLPVLLPSYLLRTAAAFLGFGKKEQDEYTDRSSVKRQVEVAEKIDEDETLDDITRDRKLFTVANKLSKKKPKNHEHWDFRDKNKRESCFTALLSKSIFSPGANGRPQVAPAKAKARAETSMKYIRGFKSVAPRA